MTWPSRCATLRRRYLLRQISPSRRAGRRGPAIRSRCARLRRGERVCKYGAPIGVAAKAIARGEWVHTHNLRSDLGGVQALSMAGFAGRGSRACQRVVFRVYARGRARRRAKRRVDPFPTVGCVNERAARIAAAARPFVHGSVDAVTAFSHPYGCSQMAEDQEAFRRALAALAGHPNAGGVLLLGLGCENSGIEQLRPYLGANPRLRTLVCQDVEDEIGEGVRLVRELIDEATRDVRETVDASRLVVGLKCGGSDGFSGITANPAHRRVQRLDRRLRRHVGADGGAGDVRRRGGALRPLLQPGNV